MTGKHIRKTRGAALGLSVLLLLSAAGCGKDEKKETSAPTTQQVTETVTEKTEEIATEAVTETDTQNITPGDGREEGLTSRDGLWDYLDGSWEFFPHGYGTPLEDKITLTFSRTEENLTMTRESDKAFAMGRVLMSKLSDADAADDVFTFVADEVSPAFCTADGVQGSTTDFQFMMGSMNGQDVLALRQMGNGDSALVMNSYLRDTTAWDGFWIFSRENEKNLTDFQMDEVRIKGDSFYAFLWQDYGDNMFLQPISAREEELDWYGEQVAAVKWSLTSDENAYDIVRYWLKDGQYFAHSGGFMPGVVSVTTDESGEVLSLVPLEYLGYGEYRLFYSMAEENSDYRSDALYRTHDMFYLGEWSGAGQFPQTMRIEAASPEVGGYQIYFDLMFENGDTVQMTADAHIEGGYLLIHSVSPEDGSNPFTLLGRVRLCDVGAEFIITDSTDDRLVEGCSYTFFRKTE